MDRSRAARVAVRVTGTVQGVGFRPFVYGLAVRSGLRGFVRNDGGAVYIEVQGPDGALRSFLEALSREAPPLSRVRDVTVEPVEVVGEGGAVSHEGQGFQVIESRRAPGSEPGISPDVSLCGKCRREQQDPADRRYLYPFINCTDCGPRFTIADDSPYDRGNTSMRAFAMCPWCAHEYSNPEDRRFHAEPDACWECGPQVRMYALDDGARDSGEDGTRDAWIAGVQDAFHRGEILAIKGVGGFHLACDAANAAAVEELRRRKRRPTRPLAIMVRDAQTAEEWFEVSPAERELLQSPASPIVILGKRPCSGCPVSASVAPGLDHFGVMLPYSPLHTLLFQRLHERRPPPRALVMTSGNATGMPLAYREDEAERDLGPISHRFVVHNRPIVRPCDDSVVRVVLDKPLFYRRSRGYVPADCEVPLTVGRPVGPSGCPGAVELTPRVFAAGAEGKNTFCFLREGRARVSQHVGDLYNREGLARYKSLVRDLAQLYRFSPEVLALDMHPGYEVSKAAQEVFPGVPVVQVQHHHAHMVQAMAEHGIESPCVGIILDGTGYGPEGQVWGGEILYGDLASFRRVGHLREVAMPGGEKAVLEPWRMAAAYLKGVYKDAGLDIAKRLFPGEAAKLGILFPIVEWEGYPRTSSAGRLFDAVSALLGLSLVSTYDGESASLLGEAALRGASVGPGARDTHGDGVDAGSDGSDGSDSDDSGLDAGDTPLNTFPLVSQVVESLLLGERPEAIAYGFHRGLAGLLASHACRVAAARGVRHVVLSGGVYQNPLFLRLIAVWVSALGFTPVWPQAYPPNDGGISLGQAVAARYKGSRG